MAWNDLAAAVNQIVVDTFQDSLSPTCTFTPTAGGGPFTIPVVELETSRDERTSSGVVTALFIYLSNLTALSAPTPSIKDSIVWKSTSYTVQRVTTDPEDGVRVWLRKV